MIASTHIAAGLVVGMGTAYATERQMVRLAVGFTLGVVSHVILDAIPHADYGSLPAPSVQWIVLAEIVAMTAVGWFILRTRLRPQAAWYLIPGLAGAILPDIKFLARVVLPPPSAEIVRRYGDRFHGLFHAAPMANHDLGQAIQIASTLLLIAVLTTFPRTRHPS